jgi:hypothetical protein
LRQVMLFKIPAIWMLLHCASSCFSKCQLFECISIVSGHAFQNACHLNAPLLCHNLSLPFPEGKTGRYVNFSNQNTGQRDGITASTRCKHIQHSYSEKYVLTDHRLMNAHLAYISIQTNAHESRHDGPRFHPKTVFWPLCNHILEGLKCRDNECNVYFKYTAHRDIHLIFFLPQCVIDLKERSHSLSRYFRRSRNASTWCSCLYLILQTVPHEVLFHHTHHLPIRYEFYSLPLFVWSKIMYWASILRSKQRSRYAHK